MTAGSYGLTHTDVESFTGITYTDMMNNGKPMTEGEWETFCEYYIEVCAQTAHKFMGVPTFDPAQAEASIIELHSGRGATDDSTYPVQYLPTDYTFYLRNVYYSGGTALKVEEDTADKTAVPAWTERTVRSALSGGDYEIVTKNEITLVRFHNNIPGAGEDNVRFTYTTGYASTSKPYKDIRTQILRVFKNLLLVKKNIQAVITVQAHGGREYQPMTNMYDEGTILSNMEMSVLKRYQRAIVPGGPFTD